MAIYRTPIVSDNRQFVLAFIYYMCKEFYRLIYVKVKLRWFSFALFSLLGCWCVRCVSVNAAILFLFSAVCVFLFIAFRGISLFRFALIPYTLVHSFDRKLILFDRCWVSSLSEWCCCCCSRCYYSSLSAHCISPCVSLQCSANWWVWLKLRQMFRIIMCFFVCFIFFLGPK